MALSTQEYLGKSVAYPLSLTAGSITIATGTDVIKGALTMLLTTPLGSREMLPAYGCDIDSLLWEPNDKLLQTLLRTAIVDSVNKWEKRIKLLDVAIVTKEDLSLCRLIYRILKSNEIDSFVYPFYRKQLPY